MVSPLPSHWPPGKSVCLTVVVFLSLAFFSFTGGCELFEGKCGDFNSVLGDLQHIHLVQGWLELQITILADQLNNSPDNSYGFIEAKTHS